MIDGHPRGAVQPLAAGQADGVAKLYDTGFWKERVNLPAHRDSVTGLAFTRDGKVLATASHDGSIKIWQLGMAKPAVTARK